MRAIDKMLTQLELQRVDFALQVQAAMIRLFCFLQ